VTEPRLGARPAEPYLQIAGRIEDDVSAFVDGAFDELFGWLDEHGVERAGPEFILFRELDANGRPLDVEVSVPVPANTEGDDRVTAAELPAGSYLTKLHHGPYHPESGPDLSDSLAELTGWAAQNGIELSDWFVEHYLIGPETEPDDTKWLTEFAYLVLDD
jgi:effector-binding domain-containing protein